jgi:drug/metabolite transporter (DMT)-like permease
MAGHLGALPPNLTPRVNPGVAFLLWATSIWGGTYVVTNALLGSIGPFSILVCRFVLATLLLGPLAWRSGFRPRMFLNPVLWLFGFTGMVLHLSLETVGLRYTSPGSAALVIATNPAVTLAASVLFLKERLNWKRGAGISLSVAGAALVTRADLLAGDGSELVGNLLVFAGVLAWAAYAVQGKLLSTSMPGIVSTAGSAGAAAMMMTPFAIGETLTHGLPSLDAGSISGLLFLGVGASALAFALWNASLKHVDASVAGTYVNLVPVVGVILALAVGDTMTLGQWFGAAIVAAGVWLTDRSRREP